MLRVAYQGVPGAYSEKACRELLGKNVNAIGYPTFEEAFQAVVAGDATYAMVPIENSLGGSIHTNYDMLCRYHTSVHILAELDFRVSHCLLANHGVSLSDITRVLSHPQALAQCDGYLRAHKFKGVAEYDTAGSAEIIQQNHQWKDAAAIASDLAAEYYDLQVLATGIEDSQVNFTRFLLLGTTAHSESVLSTVVADSPRVELKTSLVFSFDENLNKTGQLYKALSAFSLREIDMIKIESRPGNLATTHSAVAVAVDRTKYKYLFYVDIAGHVYETKVQKAISHLQEFCSVRVLGSYPSKGVLKGDVATSTTLASSPKATSCKKLRIGIIGFGNFGQFLAKTFTISHTVFCTSRTDYSHIAKEMGATFIPMFDLEAFFSVGDLDVVVIATSITSFENIVLSKVVPAIMSSQQKQLLIVDVLSVKIHPKNVLLSNFPSSKIDILCTHPMFGPESGKHSWRNLPMMYDRVRISKNGEGSVCDTFLGIFEKAHCRMIEMTCEEHDEYAASSQFVTHLTGRILDRLTLRPTPIDTTGFRSILSLVDTTCKDSYDLFFGLYKYNCNSKKLIQKLQDGLNEVVRHLKVIEGGNKSDEKNDRRLNPLVTSITPSATVGLHATTQQLLAEGHQIVSLCVGEPDYLPHQSVLDAGAKALADGDVKYTSVAGTLELRKAISSYLDVEKKTLYRPDSEIIVCNGGKQAVYQAMLAICTEGDEVIVPSPYWVSYPEIVKLSLATPVILDTPMSNGYVITPDALRKVLTSKTRAIVFSNPSNPTGTVHSRNQLEALASVLREPEFKNVVVISDEIYERLTFEEDDHVSFASLPEMKERTILVNGFSKGYAMTGFRLGYAAGPVHIIKAMTTLQGQITSCASSISQKAAVTAMSLPPSYRETVVAALRTKRDLVLKGVRSWPHVFLECVPEGAFYVFPDVSAYKDATSLKTNYVIKSASDLCTYLLTEAKVAIVPGEAFGAPWKIRIAYAASIEDLKAAVLGIKNALVALKIKQDV